MLGVHGDGNGRDLVGEGKGMVGPLGLQERDH